MNDPSVDFSNFDVYKLIWSCTINFTPGKTSKSFKILCNERVSKIKWKNLFLVIILPNTFQQT